MLKKMFLLLLAVAGMSVASAGEISPLMELMAECQSMRGNGNLAAVGTGHGQSLEAARMDADIEAMRVVLDSLKKVSDRLVLAWKKEMGEQDVEPEEEEKIAVTKGIDGVVARHFNGLEADLQGFECIKHIERSNETSGYSAYSLCDFRADRISLIYGANFGDTLSGAKAKIRKNAAAARNRGLLVRNATIINTDKKKAAYYGEVQARVRLAGEIFKYLAQAVSQSSDIDLLHDIELNRGCTVGGSSLQHTLYDITKEAVSNAKVMSTLYDEAGGVYSAEVWVAYSKSEILDIVKREIRKPSDLFFYGNDWGNGNCGKNDYVKFLLPISKAIAKDISKR